MSHDPRTAEEFRRDLLEATLFSLIRDPSRWSWDSEVPRTGGREGRAQPRTKAQNRCPGWMCGAVLDAPLPPGRYCSEECKRQTKNAQTAFRDELNQVRSGLTRPPCRECGKEITRSSRKAKYCSAECQVRNSKRNWLESLRHRTVEARKGRTCQVCGREIPVTRRQANSRKVVACSYRCYQRESMRQWRAARHTKREAPA